MTVPDRLRIAAAFSILLLVLTDVLCQLMGVPNEQSGQMIVAAVSFVLGFAFLPRLLRKP